MSSLADEWFGVEVARQRNRQIHLPIRQFINSLLVLTWNRWRRALERMRNNIKKQANKGKAVICNTFAELEKAVRLSHCRSTDSHSRQMSKLTTNYKGPYIHVKSSVADGYARVSISIILLTLSEF